MRVSLALLDFEKVCVCVSLALLDFVEVCVCAPGVLGLCGGVCVSLAVLDFVEVCVSPWHSWIVWW